MAAGTYSTGASPNCTQCPAGQFQKDPGQTGCTGITAGSYQDQPGQTAPIPCPLGWFNDRANATNCTRCLKGEYQNRTGQSGCLPCPAGTFGEVGGLSVCTPCPAGSYSTGGASDCVLCLQGEYASVAGSVNCSKCDKGTYAPTKGTQTCIKCPAGKFSAVEGEGSQCQDCLEGEYQNVTGQSRCSDCDSGTFANGRGFASCLPCPAGTFGLGSRLIECTVCPVASYQDRPGILLFALYSSVTCLLRSPCRRACTVLSSVLDIAHAYVLNSCRFVLLWLVKLAHLHVCRVVRVSQALCPANRAPWADSAIRIARLSACGALPVMSTTRPIRRPVCRVGLVFSSHWRATPRASPASLVINSSLIVVICGGKTTFI